MSKNANMDSGSTTTQFEIGASAIKAYSRLSYTMWYALAEFVDNSTQSRLNYEGLIEDVFKKEGTTLKIEITYDRDEKTMTIRDNSIGMSRERLINALKIAQPTQDSKGRSKYGMGMKTAACWIGNRWSVTTCEWDSGEEWTARVNVNKIAAGQGQISLEKMTVSKDLHYTEIKISDLNRTLQRRTEQNIVTYLGSMYRKDIQGGKLILLFNGNPVPTPEDMEMAKTEEGHEAKESFETVICGKKVTGWFGVLSSGGRKFGGFSIFQHDRQIQGYPDAWKPKSVFGGVDDEGGNSLVSQRLTGVLNLDEFDVSHTKDAILFMGSEEEEIERFLVARTKQLKAFASSMRKGTKGTPWSKQKVSELLESVKQEFNSSEIKETIDEAVLPPLSQIQTSNLNQVNSLKPEDIIFSLEFGHGLKIRVCVQDRTDNDPHLTLSSEVDGVLTIIINNQHPYYLDIESTERADEILRQYLYDAVAEYRVLKSSQRFEPDVIRRFKDSLLRAKITRLHNLQAESQEREAQRL